MKTPSRPAHFPLRPLALACTLALSQGNVSAAGYNVTTLAGDMLYLRDTVADAASARYHSPSGLARDPATGDIYISDFYNHRIRKMTTGGTVTTLAGGTLGAADGVGSAAQFSYPRSLVYIAPFLYVADNTFNDGLNLDAGTLRRIDTSDGTVTTLAGTANAQNYIDATGTAARFKGLHSIAADASGNLLLTDRGNCVIRHYDVTSLMVSTFAGTIGGAHGCTVHDDAAASAGFSDPAGIVYDSYTTNVYVSEPSSHRIRRIGTSGGIATAVDTIAGNTQGATDGPGNAAEFNRPSGMVTLPSGSVYIADTGNNLIRLMDSDGIVSTYAGNGTAASIDGPRRGGSVLAPAALTYDSDSNLLYITEDVDLSGALRKVDATSLTTHSGRFFDFNVDGAAGSATFSNPSGIVADASGNIYVADASNSSGIGHTLRKITGAGVVSTYAGNPTAMGSYLDDIGTNALFRSPSAVALDGAGNLYVADTGNHFIRKVASDGTVTTIAGDGTDVDSGTNLSGDATQLPLPFPSGIAYDGMNNALYVSLGALDCIRKINLSPTPIQIAPLAGTCAGESVNAGNLDGLGAMASFRTPDGLAYKSSEQMLYLADKGNNRIRKIDVSSGAVSAVAGSIVGGAGSMGHMDGTGTNATFSSPSGIAFDSGGNLLVADTGSQRIRRVSSTGVVSTIAGGDAGYVDATGTAARFNQPSGVAFNPATGHILVTDKANGLVRELTPPPAVSHFTNQSHVALGSVVTSAPITLAGLPDSGTHPGSISCPAGDTNCVYSINGTPSSGAGFKNGDTLTITLTAASSYSTTVTASLTIVDLPEVLSFSASTAAAPTAPTFPSITGATPGTVYTSSSQTVSGLPSPTTGNVYCPAGDSHCGAIVTSGGVATTYLAIPSISFPVQNGDDVQFQLTAPRSYGSSATATMTVAGLSGTASFTVSTAAEPYVPPPTSPLTNIPAGTTPVGNVGTVFDNAGNSGATINNGVVVLPTSGGVSLTLNDNAPSNVAIRPSINVPVVIRNSTGASVTITGLTPDTTVVTRKLGNTVVVEVASGTARLEPAANATIPLASSGNHQAVSTLTPEGNTPSAVVVRRDAQAIQTFIENGKMVFLLRGIGANGFTDEGQGTSVAIYSGETAKFSNSGDLSRIRLGSLDGDRNLPGDPLRASGNDSALPLTEPGVIVPRLDGAISRLEGQSLLDGIRGQIDAAFGQNGDNSSIHFDPASGLLTYRVGPFDRRYYEGRFTPVGELLVALTAFTANGFGATNPAQAVSGAFNLTDRGVQVTLSSALGYFNELNSAVKNTDPSGGMTLQASGALLLRLNSEQYIAQPGYLVEDTGVTGAPLVEEGKDGLLFFRDSKGSRQPLYPALSSPDTLQNVLRGFDPQATVEVLGGGEAKARVGSQEFRLKPQYKLQHLDLLHLNEPWWLQNGMFYYTLPNGRAQAIVVN